jgi:hypothetical protein
MCFAAVPVLSAVWGNDGHHLSQDREGGVTVVNYHRLGRYDLA